MPHLFYFDQQAHIHESSLPPDGHWVDSDLTTSTGIVPSLGNPFSLIAFEGSHYSRNIVYVSNDQHIHYITGSPGGNWTDSDVTHTSNLPILGNPTHKQYVANVTGYLDNHGYPNIVYFDAESAIRQISSPAPGMWTSNILDSQLRYFDPIDFPVNGVPIVSYLANDNTENVVYISPKTDNTQPTGFPKLNTYCSIHLHTAPTYPSGDWGDIDISTSTSPYGTSGALAVYQGRDHNKHVVFIRLYVFGGPEIHQLTAPPAKWVDGDQVLSGDWGSGNWVDENLTTLAQATPLGPAFTSVCGYGGDDNSQNVIYIDDDKPRHLCKFTKSQDGNWVFTQLVNID